MAAPANKKCRAHSHKPDDSATEQLRIQFNNLLAAFRIMAAKLDLDAGVTDLNYFLLTCDSAMGATAPTVIDAIP